MPVKHSHRQPRDAFASVMLAVAIIEPFTTLPQIKSVWIDQNIAGVSLLSWAAYSLAVILWIIYGIKIRDLPLTVASILWGVGDWLVVIGVLMHH